PSSSDSEARHGVAVEPTAMKTSALLEKRSCGAPVESTVVMEPATWPAARVEARAMTRPPRPTFRSAIANPLIPRSPGLQAINVPYHRGGSVQDAEAGDSSFVSGAAASLPAERRRVLQIQTVALDRVVLKRVERALETDQASV